MGAAKPTLRDVAERAGVSLGTASNVLNNRDNVSDEARAKVVEAATALGYRMQVRVSAATRHSLSVVGAIGKIDDGQTMMINPFYSYVLAGIEWECQRNNLSLMLANIMVDNLNRPPTLPPMLLDNHVDGVLLVGTFLEDTIQLVGKRFEKPVVLIDAYAPGSHFDSVVTDNISGAYAAVKYLIKQGHQKIALVGSMPDSYPSIRERRKGYLRALKNHRISDVYIEDSPLNREGGFDATCNLLQHSPEITAIFACNDEVAYGAILAARQLGRDVPDDLSVIGFDDIDLARQMSPALTTVRVDKRLMGTLAVQYLVARAENPGNSALTTLISTQIVVRDSVKALNARS
ncbi:MAG: LacI family DNA-binding transcriptional regulator [Anaerolinea sp.]|nr:LacI family DNA-binding transcriptional regulator [Anaerolinea sp.]